MVAKYQVDRIVCGRILGIAYSIQWCINLILILNDIEYNITYHIYI